MTFLGQNTTVSQRRPPNMFVGVLCPCWWFLCCAQEGHDGVIYKPARSFKWQIGFIRIIRGLIDMVLYQRLYLAVGDGKNDTPPFTNIGCMSKHVTPRNADIQDVTYSYVFDLIPHTC